MVSADLQPLGRQVVLYGVIHALTERLRSVFVPYFRYVLDGAIALLTGQAADASAQPKKKRKKSKAVEPLGDVVSTDAGIAQNTWLLRFRVGAFIHYLPLCLCRWRRIAGTLATQYLLAKVTTMRSCRFW